MITITLISGRPFIWKAEDVCTAREQHRIIGHLVGCLPRLPRQNVCLGLPLQLLREEAMLLKERGLAVIVEGAKEPHLPTQEEREEHNKRQKDLYEQQISLRKEERIKEMQACSHLILAGKKEKQRRILKQKEKEGEIIPPEKWQEVEDMTFDPEDIPPAPMAEKNMFVQIPTVLSESPTQPTEMSFPESELDSLRYMVFCDLWERGFYLTAAGKFGGDFLVYPGDPSLFHSRYIAVCVHDSHRLNNLDMSTIARLGTSVKKQVLLCSLSGSGGLNYTTLQWAGIS